MLHSKSTSSGSWGNIDVCHFHPVMPQPGGFIIPAGDVPPVRCTAGMQPLVQRMGVSVIVTDDLMMYKVVAQHLNLEPQICQFHVRRRVGRTLKELENTLPKEWLWVVGEIKELITELPPEGERRLVALWKQAAVRRGKGSEHLTPIDQLRHLLIRLSGNWPSCCAFYTDPAIPRTNNGTGQVIGRMKMPARTVRGCKNWPGMQTGLMLSGTKCNQDSVD